MAYVYRPLASSRVRPLECRLCGRGLDDGEGLSSKRMPNGMALLCHRHFHLD